MGSYVATVPLLFIVAMRYVAKKKENLLPTATTVGWLSMIRLSRLFDLIDPKERSCQSIESNSVTCLLTPVEAVLASTYVRPPPTIDDAKEKSQQKPKETVLTPIILSLFDRK